SSSPSLYKMGSKWAPAAMTPFTEDDKISKGPGPLKEWTAIRDFPAPHKSRFRDWFKDREKQKGEE
ncbi:lactate utilisation protein LutB domain-containing protein, partial [Bacillus toyonensis]